MSAKQSAETAKTQFTVAIHETGTERERHTLLGLRALAEAVSMLADEQQRIVFDIASLRTK